MRASPAGRCFVKKDEAGPAPTAIIRCPWCEKDDLYRAYHDLEWGVPVHDDAKHFEFLLLETMQAGLSWYGILSRREGFRAAFDGFDWHRIAEYGEGRVAALMADARIIRNRRKIEGAIRNARAFEAVRREWRSFDAYIWSWTDGQVVRGDWTDMRQIPVTTALSDRVAADMKSRGFAFVGSTTIYAHLQAIGVVDDHLVSCFRRTGAG